MRDEIMNLKNQALGRIGEANSAEEIEQIRIDYLGRNGELSKFFKEMGKLSPNEKKEVGFVINEAKSTIEEFLGGRKAKIKESTQEFFDPTIPGIKPVRGHTHILTQSIQEIENIFSRLGFVRRRYPEVDWDWYAFSALNFPKGHPAWDTLETYYVDAPSDEKLGEMILTPHTSNGQVREMERVEEPPIRMVNISKTYRRQADISHTPMFHQFEGLVIDKNISITHLKGTLDYFAKEFFGEKRVTRLRPHNFRFTEPSFEVDIICGVCNGKGCRVCKDGWLEMGGAGMVHPNVLKAGGIDPIKYSGFAFGWGVERVTMMRDDVNIPDLRILYSSDIEYLKQF